MSWWRRKFGRFFSTSLLSKVYGFLKGKSVSDEVMLGELRALMIEADLGLSLTEKALEHLRVSKEKPLLALKQFLEKSLSDYKVSFSAPLNVVFIVGVNGVGKTTTIAKLANYYKDNHDVLVASGDTFRAAAEDQLQHWMDKVGVECVKCGHTKDPAAVVYDAVTQAKEKKKNLLIVDTAGRMHGNQNLIDQLKKMKRVCQKIDGQLVPKVWLVLDGSLGQSNIAQAKTFQQDIGAEGVVLTKVDGSSKGGVAFAVADQLNLPILFLGVGESLEDLVEFDHQAFVERVFEE